MNTTEISEHYDEISHCNRCGFCQVACPIFRSTGHEAGVARGRLALLRAIIEGRLEWNQEIEEPLFDCLLCGACTANCFPAIPTADLVIKARAQYLEKVGRKSIHQLLFDHLLPYPHRLHLAARAVALGKNTGVADLAGALGLLRIFGRDFVNANEIVKRIPSRPFRDQIKTHILNGQGQSLRIGYFVGCGIDIISQDAGHATLQLLKKIGKAVHVLKNGCCGLPAWSYGDLKAARKLAERNLSILASEKFDVIVTDCSSCASFLKNYPKLFSEAGRNQEKAAMVSARVRDMVQLIHATEVNAPSPEQAVTATYHHPCHAARGQGLSAEPGEILNRLPGVEYRPLPEADWCCGGAGAYAFAHYELSQQVLDRKIENLKKTGADLLVTSCPACIMHLSYGVRKHGLSTRVCHISEIV
jgi:glycolate oxidase iron-sulfur subunit